MDKVMNIPVHIINKILKEMKSNQKNRAAIRELGRRYRNENTLKNVHEQSLFNELTVGNNIPYTPNLNIIKKAIKMGANVNKKDKYKMTPLHWATLKGYENVVKLLLEKGAHVNVKNHEGLTPLTYIISKTTKSEKNKRIERLLQSKKIN